MTSKVNYHYYHRYDESSYYIIDLHVTNASPNNSRIHLEIPYFSINQDHRMPPDQSKMISIKLNQDILRNGTFTERRGLRITSDNDVTVLVTVVELFLNRSYVQSYNVLPRKSAGSRYVSFKSDVNYGMSVMIAGIYNNTVIRLYNDTRYLHTAYLNSLDVHQVWTSYDNSVLVDADKDVTVVFATQIYGDVRFQYHSADEYSATSVIPSNQWSTAYIVPPITVTDAFQIRYFSENKFLRVTLSNASATFTLTELHDKYLFENETLVLTAAKPFSVIQSSYDFKSNIASNKFMTIVPGVDQYINDYRFTVPLLGYLSVLFKNYISVIIPTMNKDGLLIDGVPLQSMPTNSAEEFSVPSPFNNFTVLSFQISEGYHRIHHPVTHVRFGLLVYGYKRSPIYGYNGWYGFYAGFHFGDGCSELMNEVTTSSTTRFTKQSTRSSTRSSTLSFTAGSTTGSTTGFTASPLTNGNNVISGPNNTNMCYSCEDLAHIDLCDRITPCPGKEMCFLERRSQFGRIVYRSGCLSSDQCTRHHISSTLTNDPCVECCNGSFCNNQGCGELGLPDRTKRGPVCFDCQHVWSPGECTSVTLCLPEQVCRIEQYTWGDHFHYKMGCADSVCDPLKRSVHSLSKRSTPVCHTCCDGDYCNSNCTRKPNAYVGPEIVG